MSDETTLLPCPFCGGEPEMHYTRPTEGIREGWLIWCHKCHAGGNWHTKEEDAIRIWNTRVTHGTLTAEQVREAIEANSWAETSTIREFNDSSWQAIADELNVELGSEINGETSDGYHTFNELYHHRAVLFSVIVRDHRELAWKAMKHHDGTMYDGMFIVGIETPKGQATYHYDLDPYWEMFDCEEREFAPEWDGHTPDEAIARIAELGSGTCHDTGDSRIFHCSKCEYGLMDVYIDDEFNFSLDPNFCPNCGAEIQGQVVE